MTVTTLYRAVNFQRQGCWASQKRLHGPHVEDEGQHAERDSDGGAGAGGGPDERHEDGQDDVGEQAARRGEGQGDGEEAVSLVWLAVGGPVGTRRARRSSVPAVGAAEAGFVGWVVIPVGRRRWWERRSLGAGRMAVSVGAPGR